MDNFTTNYIIGNIEKCYPKLTQLELETLKKLDESWVFQLTRFIRTKNVKFKAQCLDELECFLDNVEHMNDLQNLIVTYDYSVMLDQLINIWDGQLRSVIEKGYE